MTTTYTSIIYPTNYRQPEKPELTLYDIKKAVSDYLNIPDIAIRSRRKEVAYARHIYCTLSKQLIKCHWAEISELLGRDRTTAMNSNNTLQNWMDTDSTVREDVANIKAIINEKRNYAITERGKIA